jgi:hypothetical protein
MNDSDRSVGERDLTMAIGVLGVIALLAIIINIIA